MRYLVIKNKIYQKQVIKNEITKLKLKSIFYNTRLPFYIRQSAATALFSLPFNRSRGGCIYSFKSKTITNYFKCSRIRLRTLMSNNYFNGVKKK